MDQLYVKGQARVAELAGAMIEANAAIQEWAELTRRKGATGSGITEDDLRAFDRRLENAEQRMLNAIATRKRERQQAAEAKARQERREAEAGAQAAQETEEGTAAADGSPSPGIAPESG